MSNALNIWAYVRENKMSLDSEAAMNFIDAELDDARAAVIAQLAGRDKQIAGKREEKRRISEGKEADKKRIENFPDQC